MNLVRNSKKILMHRAIGWKAYERVRRVSESVITACFTRKENHAVYPNILMSQSHLCLTTCSGSVLYWRTNQIKKYGVCLQVTKLTLFCKSLFKKIFRDCIPFDDARIIECLFNSPLHRSPVLNTGIMRTSLRENWENWCLKTRN